MLVRNTQHDVDLDLSHVLGEEWRGIEARFRANYRIEKRDGQLYEVPEITEWAQFEDEEGQPIHFTGEREVKCKVENYIKASPETLIQEDSDNE